MHQNNFSLFLRTLLAQYTNSKKLQIHVKIKLGEQVIIKEKKYSIIVLELKGNERSQETDKELSTLASKNCINVSLQKESVTLEIPAIS